MTTELITRREAARRLDVCLNTFDKKVRPYVQTVRIGRRVLVIERSLEEFVRGRAT